MEAKFTFHVATLGTHVEQGMAVMGIHGVILIMRAMLHFIVAKIVLPATSPVDS